MKGGPKTARFPEVSGRAGRGQLATAFAAGFRSARYQLEGVTEGGEISAVKLTFTAAWWDGKL